MAELVITTNLTYKKGRDAIKDVLSSKQMRYVLYGANILGMGMMGALSANMVNLQSKLNFGFGKAAINVQENLDKIFPGILTILVLFLFYYLIGKKNFSISKLIFSTIAVSLVLSFFGIF